MRQVMFYTVVFARIFRMRHYTGEYDTIRNIREDTVTDTITVTVTVTVTGNSITN